MNQVTPMFKTSRCVSYEVRRSVEGEGCDLRLDGCSNDTSTTVLGHFRFFGMAGAGQKSHDFHGCRTCFHCHEILDGRRKGEWGWDDVLRAMMQFQDHLYQSGMMKVKGDKND